MGSLVSILPMLSLHHSTWRALGLKSRRHWAIETLIMQPVKVLLAASLLGLFLEPQLKPDGEEVTSQLFRDRRPHTPSPPGVSRQLHTEVSKELVGREGK